MSKYICELTKYQKANIISLLMGKHIHGDALWKAMNGRVCDLACIIDINQLKAAIA